MNGCSKAGYFFADYTRLTYPVKNEFYQNLKGVQGVTIKKTQYFNYSFVPSGGNYNYAINGIYVKTRFENLRLDMLSSTIYSKEKVEDNFDDGSKWIITMS